ncbi:MAG TPA: 3-hydroxyacyl-CoA dehydrogenase NAD-binding domain-containing protein [Candidatus Methylacidiphilales bacterium]|jgi:3-hydroxyacyl-CoA dehydrogenase/enoyl-CoA hydratase/3-hydroxybutyryl-CoA epimerase|nr:3-hydroxyacyl-CoA dehydrogenase NAD-binding domain-containing protein [Candidatus Methylacidiphilales bacterium]
MNDIHREITPNMVCVLRFDQAGLPANLFNPETLAELNAHLDDIEANGSLRGVVFISGKERLFHAGADLRGLEKMDREGLCHFLEQGQNVFNRIAHLKIPSVAAIHGVCLGGGCELALACTYRIATNDHATKIGLPETRLGILPAWGGSTRLPRLIGVTRALKIILGGQTPSARQALRYGMIDAIAPRELLLSAALRMLTQGRTRRRDWKVNPLVNRLTARLIAPSVRTKMAKQGRGHYPARTQAAEVVLASPRSTETASLARERKVLLELAGTDTCKNLIRLFFMSERARKSEGPKAPPIERAMIVGAGVMGSGIAEWLAARGVRVILRDIDPKFVAKGLDRIRKLFSDRRVFTEKEGRDAMDRISPAVGDVPLDQVELVIEAAVETMDAKKQIFAALDQQARRADTILATNTSALSLAEIAGATKNPARVVGIHYFNPVHKMQLVEVVAGVQTSPEVVRRAVQFVQQIGKLPVVVKDSPGFLVNRVLVPYLLEAGLLFEAGARVEDIDEAMLDFGMPMGPLRLLDEVGIDIAFHVANTLAAKFSDRMRVPPELGEMVKAGWLGQKSGRGFYLYGSGKKSVYNSEMDKLRRTHDAASLPRSELQLRLALLLVSESARCLEEQVVADAATIDFAIVMGTGFAPFRGGPLRYADALGLGKVVSELERLSREAGPHFTPSPLLKKLASEGKRFHEN